jgi:hypothetical protein
MQPTELVQTLAEVAEAPAVAGLEVLDIFIQLSADLEQFA